MYVAVLMALNIAHLFDDFSVLSDQPNLVLLLKVTDF